MLVWSFCPLTHLHFFSTRSASSNTWKLCWWQSSTWHKFQQQQQQIQSSAGLFVKSQDTLVGFFFHPGCAGWKEPRSVLAAEQQMELTNCTSGAAPAAGCSHPPMQLGRSQSRGAPTAGAPFCHHDGPHFLLHREMHFLGCWVQEIGMGKTGL